MIAEPRAAEVRFRQRVSLDHRSHRAVEVQDPLSEELVQAIGGRHAYLFGPFFKPLAIRTANGSPALLAPTWTRTSASPAARSRASSSDEEKPRCRSPNRFFTHAWSCSRRSRIRSRP